LARQEAHGLAPKVAIRPLVHRELEEPAEPMGAGISPESMIKPPSFLPLMSSPSPSSSFMGLDDVAMVDSGYVVIPPDVGGGVGPTKVMCSFNTNYRIQDKTTGATLQTVGTATFWNPVITDKKAYRRPATRAGAGSCSTPTPTAPRSRCGSRC